MAGELSPEDAQKILKKDLANIIKKSKEGKTLNNQERAIVQQFASGDATSEAEIDTRDKAANLTELAEILGCSRPTLNTWRKMDGAPKPESDSTWQVLPWRTFMQLHDLKGYKGKRGPGAINFEWVPLVSSSLKRRRAAFPAFHYGTNSFLQVASSTSSSRRRDPSCGAVPQAPACYQLELVSRIHMGSSYLRIELLHISEM